ncbi:MAG: IS200/IS605 family transposase [Bacteroidaceae bacterium]|nr:IS200/IS605 family transposase [Bacteroidaceae bacterium]
MHPEGVPHPQYTNYPNLIMAYTKLIYHIVLRTYQGTAPIAEEHERDLYMYIFGFCKNHQCVLYRINGMPDHIHLLVSLHPTIAVASFVHDLKIATNNFMSANRDRFPAFVKWEQGYCALTYSEADKERIMQYIINQKEHHRKLSVRDELIALLQECGVEYDERYI